MKSDEDTRRVWGGGGGWIGFVDLYFVRCTAGLNVTTFRGAMGDGRDGYINEIGNLFRNDKCLFLVGCVSSIDRRSDGQLCEIHLRSTCQCLMGWLIKVHCKL